jgi:UDP-N-acetylmuramate dehydrogenase
MLTQILGERVRCNEVLSQHTTVRIGGPADGYIEALTAEDLSELVSKARQAHIPYFVLGGGSNVLVHDAGVRGLVIANRAKRMEFKRLRLYTGAEYTRDTFVWAESGVGLAALAHECIAQGYANLEWAVGVPGTVGGAVLGNAGAFGGSVARDLISVTVLDEADVECNWSNAQCEFDYRTSRLKKMRAQGAAPVVLAAAFRLQSSSREALAARAAEFTQQRKRVQPSGATMGSVFKNPPGDYAGRLIEAAGLKCLQRGQAQISPLHANFFVNLGGATCADMQALIDLARERVKQQFGIDLELEIDILGAQGPGTR